MSKVDDERIGKRARKYYGNRFQGLGLLPLQHGAWSSAKGGLAADGAGAHVYAPQDIANGVLTQENPWLGVSKFKTHARERFLSPEEIARFFDALKALDNRSGFRDYIYIWLVRTIDIVISA